MSTIGVSEFDAAQALLDLQSNNRETNHNGDQHSKEAVETAKLFLSCLLVSNVQNPPPKKPVAVPKIGTVSPIYTLPKSKASKPFGDPASSSTPIPKRISPDQELPRDPRVSTYHDEHTNKRSKIFKRKPVKHNPSANNIEIETNNIKANKVNDSAKNKYLNTVIVNDIVKSKPKTREVGTQTEDLYELPVIESMEFTITKLCEKIKALEAQIRSNSQLIETINQDVLEDNNDDDDDDDESYKPNSNDVTVDDSFDMDETFTDDEKETKPKNKAGPHRVGVKSSKILSNRNTNTNADDMIPIGYGNAMIPARVFRHINWNSYTSATRKLLTAVFSRRVLATHSLTGKPSPAFPLKPPKKRLDAAIVNDIVQTVVERCSVPENVVRTSITTKCADESKMFRTRQQNKKKRKQKINSENIPPNSESD